MASFSERVYALCARIPKGRVTTYGEIAKAMHSKAYRAVGQALHNNRHGFVNGNRTVPCHRVVKADGSLGGFAHGLKRKKELLEKEGVKVRRGKVSRFKGIFFRLIRD